MVQYRVDTDVRSRGRSDWRGRWKKAGADLRGRLGGQVRPMQVIVFDDEPGKFSVAEVFQRNDEVCPGGWRWEQHRTRLRDLNRNKKKRKE